MNEVRHTYECIIAVCGSVLQCVAVCCSVLCHSKHMDEVRHTYECVVAVCYSVLRCVAVCCVIAHI